MHIRTVVSLAAILLVSGCGVENQEDCLADAAREAKSDTALGHLVAKCRTDFPGRRTASGGYEFFDPVTKQSVTVSGPRLTTEDRTKVDTARAEWLRALSSPEALAKRAAFESRRQIEYDVAHEAARAAYDASDAYDTAAAAATDAAAAAPDAASAPPDAVQGSD
jgi:hypothetical protein